MARTLGDYLKQLREQKGWTMTEAAEKTGIHRSYLWLLEDGQRQSPRPEILKKLSLGYGINVNELLATAGYMPTSSEEKVVKKKQEEDKIEQAFRHVMSDPKFQYGTRFKSDPTLETKKFIIEMYEKLTKRKILVD